MVKTKEVNLLKSKNNKSGENKTSKITAIAPIRLSVFLSKIKN